MIQRQYWGVRLETQVWNTRMCTHGCPLNQRRGNPDNSLSHNSGSSLSRWGIMYFVNTIIFSSFGGRTSLLVIIVSAYIQEEARVSETRLNSSGKINVQVKINLVQTSMLTNMLSISQPFEQSYGKPKNLVN